MPTTPTRRFRALRVLTLACVVAACASPQALAETRQIKTLPVSEVFDRLAASIPADAESIAIRITFTDDAGRRLAGAAIDLVDGKDDAREAIEPVATGVFVIEVDRRMVRRSSDLVLTVEGHRGLVRTDLALADGTTDPTASDDGPSLQGTTAVVDEARRLAVHHRGEDRRARELLARLAAAHDGIEGRIGAAAEMRVVLRAGERTSRAADAGTWAWSFEHEPEARFLTDALRDWVARTVTERVFLRGDRKNRWIADGLIENVTLDVLAELGHAEAAADLVERRIVDGVRPLLVRSPATWDLNDFQWDRARGFVIGGDAAPVADATVGLAMAQAFWRKLEAVDPEVIRRFLDTAAGLRPSQRKNRRLIETLGELTGGSYVLEVQSFPVAEAEAHLEAYVETLRGG